jgi:hypothetical protein
MFGKMNTSLGSLSYGAGSFQLIYKFISLVFRIPLADWDILKLYTLVKVTFKYHRFSLRLYWLLVEMSEDANCFCVKILEKK